MGRSRALARLSLYSVAMAPALTGCLDAPPAYQVPDLVPPVIMTDKLDPPTSSLVRPSSRLVKFNVPFRADDAGEGLLAYFILDIPAGNPKFDHVVGNPVQIVPDPHPFAEQTKRSFDFSWALTNVDVGCHTLTLILSHEGNFDFKTGEVKVKEPTAAAYATWFFELSPPCGDWPNARTGTAP
jgi:hypothetical protein